ncbi:hypothetical protein EUX98_g9271 [Antrodiella citrinella]|uniref:DUF6532 domain-containing protein n=1 Tax=Antrodiella citrinella TaxID=2447956 RepID=A0A4S4LXL0_9APHY|nr:hypothetical protein EUX98_g9271 [Antrodiella citrinella]
MARSEPQLPATKPVKASQLRRQGARDPLPHEQLDEAAGPVGRPQRKSKSAASAAYQGERANTLNDPPPAKKKKVVGQPRVDNNGLNDVQPSTKRGAPKRKTVPVNRYEEEEDDDADADDVAFEKVARAQAQHQRSAAKKSKPLVRQEDSPVSDDPADPGHAQSEEQLDEDPQDAAFAGNEGSSAEDDEGGSSSQDEGSDESDGLEPSTVKRTLEKEQVPMWADSLDNDDDLPESFTGSFRPKVTRTYGSSGSQAGHASMQDLSDHEPDSDVASVDKKSSAARSSSKKHMAGATSLFDANNKDVHRGSFHTAGSGSRPPSKSRSATPRTHVPKRTPKVTKTSSRRQQKAKMEQPSFEESSDSDATNDADDMDVDADSADDGRGKVSQAGSGKKSSRPQWPAFTDLSYNKNGKINKLVQSVKMRCFIQECSDWVIHNIAFLNFYPEGKDKYAYLIRLMIKAAEDGEFPIIAIRMRADPVYARDLTHIPSNNVSHYRKNILRAICPLVAAAYNLLTPAHPGAQKRTIDEIKARVVALKSKRTYLFALMPGDGVQRIDAKPFEHPMVALALQAAFFSSTGPTSIGTEYAHELVSSVESDNDPEIPLPMLAMAGTIISYVLDGWSTGLYNPGKFHVETLAGVYEGTLSFIEVIRSRTNDAKFHRMRVNCLKAARDHTVQPIQVTAQEDAAGIDFGNMEE